MTVAAAPKLVGRHLRVAFMNTDATGSSPKYERMTNFTAMTNGKNPKEYSRQYVDEIAERADVVGYAPAIEYSFDRYTNNPVHEKIATIHDGEKLGDDAHVEVVVVDFFKKMIKETNATQQSVLMRSSRILTETERMRLCMADLLNLCPTSKKDMLQKLTLQARRLLTQKVITQQLNERKGERADEPVEME